ncbi:hypothetical protein [Candidatus Poriferisodalis sp.]|uniref:hypothetical protein n=1 Tax=Candidatus Poriferisodalis sp. TaxID=3101277 RepID=UPI003B52A482
MTKTRTHHPLAGLYLTPETCTVKDIAIDLGQVERAAKALRDIFDRIETESDDKPVTTELAQELVNALGNYANAVGAAEPTGWLEAIGQLFE